MQPERPTEPSEETIRRLENDLERLLGWVGAAESRLQIVLPLSTAMLGSLAVLAPAADHWTTSAGIATAFAVTLLLLSVVFSAMAAFPRTSGPKGSLIYFGGITDRDLPQYMSAIHARANAEYVEDLITQCHRNAQVAERKYAWVQRSMACLFLSALPWATALFLLYWNS